MAVPVVIFDPFSEIGFSSHHLFTLMSDFTALSVKHNVSRTDIS